VGPWSTGSASSAPPLPDRATEICWSVSEGYPELSHAHDWEAAIAATSFVPDDVVAELSDAYGLIGTPEHCAGRIAEMAKHGVRNLYVMPFQTFVPPEEEVRAFRDHIFPNLRAAGPVRSLV
jgi:alkanesulfonate monooxygenase SsuD/methylene tetrahydromethanopterin reductase-like flavin-dependent oxidoreductase (luciferase family)